MTRDRRLLNDVSYFGGPYTDTSSTGTARYVDYSACYSDEEAMEIAADNGLLLPSGMCSDGSNGYIGGKDAGPPCPIVRKDNLHRWVQRALAKKAEKEATDTYNLKEEIKRELRAKARMDILREKCKGRQERKMKFRRVENYEPLYKLADGTVFKIGESGYPCVYIKHKRAAYSVGSRPFNICNIATDRNRYSFQLGNDGEPHPFYDKWTFEDDWDEEIGLLHLSVKAGVSVQRRK